MLFRSPRHGQNSVDCVPHFVFRVHHIVDNVEEGDGAQAREPSVDLLSAERLFAAARTFFREQYLT